MKNLFKNRYAFILVADGGVGKSAIMNKLIVGLTQVQYKSYVRITLDHTLYMTNIYQDYNWNTVVCARSFYGENAATIIAKLEGYLQNPQAQFVLVPERTDFLPKLVNTLSQNNYNITCYHIWLDNDTGERYIAINKENFLLGTLGSVQYSNNIDRIKQDMYRVIMPII